MQFLHFVGLMRIVLNLWKGTEDKVQERHVWLLYKPWRRREIKIGQMRLQKWIKEQYYEVIASKEKLVPLFVKILTWRFSYGKNPISSGWELGELWIVWIVELLLHQGKDPGRCIEAIYAKGKWGVTQKMAMSPGRLVLASRITWVSAHVKGIKLWEREDGMKTGPP